MFEASLFIMVEKWKQPKCSSTGEWKNKMWYVGYFSARKRNEVLTPATTWVNTESIMLSAISQIQNRMISLI